jgi:transcriptional regulator with PAS, ATPase and Fis domain
MAQLPHYRPQKGGEMAIFNYVLANKQLKHKITGDSCYGGSNYSNDLVIPMESVEPRHFHLAKRSDQWILRSLSPQKPVEVNGVKVREAILEYEDRVKVGRFELTFTGDEPPKRPKHLVSKLASLNMKFESLPAYAHSNYPILISGPSGSGKEGVAEAIHRLSKHSAGPLIKVNCSALTETLIESELFGHKKGSFTGAIEDRKGAFEAARGGTLFLDEIGDLPIGLQAKLLRALENQEIKPVGSDQIIKIDCRIVSATHQNLIQYVTQGQFRMDLYYRLNVIEISIPSLRERLVDFDQILFDLAKAHKVCFSFDAVQKMKGYDWPGNIRELKNIVTKASVMFKGRRIGPHQLIDLGLKFTPEVKQVSLCTEGKKSFSVVKELEKELIVSRLIANRGNQKLTAKELGMPKSTLHDRVKSYGIDPRKIRDKFKVSEVSLSSTIDSLHLI